MQKMDVSASKKGNSNDGSLKLEVTLEFNNLLTFG